MSITSQKKLEHDIGYIRKSPCRGCGLEERLPECINNCKTLNQLQTNLACVTACSNNYSEYETPATSEFLIDTGSKPE